MVLKIVESTLPESIRFPILFGAKFRPGMIAQFYYTDNDIFCGISDGSRPCGLAGEYYNDNIINIWVQRMVFRTNEFEPDLLKSKDRSLYVSTNGLLTTKKPNENSQYIAKLISGPTDDRDWIEALYL